MIYFVDDVGPSPLAQNVAFRDLPLRDVGQHPFLLTFLEYIHFLHITPLTWISIWKLWNPRIANFQVLFVSERMVIGVGFDCSPMVFAADERGIWYVKNFKNVIHMWESNFVLLHHPEGVGVLKVDGGSFKKNSEVISVFSDS